MNETLTEDERRTLLELARASLQDAVGSSGAVDDTLIRATLTPILERERASFVTLKRPTADGWSLRGCIGTLEADTPLYRGVIANARRSALHDSRFAPVTSGEVREIRLEISVLTPLAKISGPEDVVPGRDGVELDKPPYGAVFLPQVAPEQGWDRTQLLEHLALKAGLPRDGWKGAAFRTFRAQVFGED